MADDLGIEGVGCYGGVSYRTPHLDKLAEEGIRFTRAYSQPLCTPTRVQIMTGRYNHRNWRAFGILDPDEKTFGHHMKAAGYDTGIFGKWQLQSYDPPDFPNARRRRATGMHPKDAGFDSYALFHSLDTEDKGSRYANPTMLEGEAGSPGVLKTYRGRYGADIWVEKILSFLRRDREQPAFVYYPMALPHWPFEPPPNSADWDPQQDPRESVAYFDEMVEYLDTTIGRLIEGLDAAGLRGETLVIFYSDNGTDGRVVSKFEEGREIRGGKATVRQTGIRVPLIVSWPGRIEPATSDRLIDASDFLPTLMELAKTEMPNEGVFDGISFAGQLLGREGPIREHAFFWYDPRPGWDKERFSRHVFAVDGDYKRFRDGRLFRLTDSPLEEVLVERPDLTPADRQADAKLAGVIRRTLEGVAEPPLVDAFGRPQTESDASSNRGQ